MEKRILTEALRETYTESVAHPLRSILEKYYLVNGKNFFEASEHEVFKHQVLHLSKMLNKVVKYMSDPKDVGAKNILKNEVAPDLLIYAQEIYLKSAEQCWRPLDQLTHQETALKSLLFHTKQRNFASILPDLSSACAALADVCDRNDHLQTHDHQYSSDIAIPFTDAAATLFSEFDLDPDVVYQTRLDSMIAKYDGWVLPT